MEELGKIYSLISLFSEEEKIGCSSQCNSAKEALGKFNELFGKKVGRLIKNLEDTNMWKVEKADHSDSDAIYWIESLSSTGKFRRSISRINANGSIYVCGDNKLENFLSNYQ